jgi:hypothetical protein
MKILYYNTFPPGNKVFYTRYIPWFYIIRKLCTKKPQAAKFMTP